MKFLANALRNIQAITAFTYERKRKTTKKIRNDSNENRRKKQNSNNLLKKTSLELPLLKWRKAEENYSNERNGWMRQMAKNDPRSLHFLSTVRAAMTSFPSTI